MIPIGLVVTNATSGVVIPDADVWYWIMAAIGFPCMIIALLAVCGAWGIYQWLTPKEAKEIRKATRKKQPLLFLFNDSGQGWFEGLKRITSSGAASTDKKAGGKHGFLGYFARKQEPVFEKPTDENIAAENLSGYVDGLQTSKIFLRNAKIPINVAYSGKALITSFLSLAGVEMASKMALADGGTVTEACPYCGQQKAPFKIVERIELTLVNITRFFKNLSDLTAWDESEQKANETDQFFLGIEEERKRATKNPLILILLAMGFCFGMAVLLVVVAYILK